MGRPLLFIRRLTSLFSPSALHFLQAQALFSLVPFLRRASSRERGDGADDHLRRGRRGEAHRHKDESWTPVASFDADRGERGRRS